MEQKTKQNKIWILLGAAVLVVLLLSFFLITSMQQKQAQQILLPEPIPEESQSETTDSPALAFTTINKDNVQKIIGSLQRPSCYHQQLTLSVSSETEAADITAELWRQGDLLRAQITKDGSVQTLLSNGKLCYVWYDGDAVPAQVNAEQYTPDELIGLPTYEDILTLPAEQILDANFVTLQELDSLPCVFVDCMQDGLRQYYWVDLQSGLLFKQTTLPETVPVYAAQQTLLEILTEDDETLHERFLLPDGTDPFSTAE